MSQLLNNNNNVFSLITIVISFRLKYEKKLSKETFNWKFIILDLIKSRIDTGTKFKIGSFGSNMVPIFFRGLKYLSK